MNQRYATTRYANDLRYYADGYLAAKRTPRLITYNSSGKRLTAALVIGSERCVVSDRKIFSMHKRDHKRFYAIVAELRTYLAKIIELASICAAPAIPLLPATIAVPQPASVAEPAVMSSLAAKSNDKYAAVTQRIMAGENYDRHYCRTCGVSMLGSWCGDIWTCSKCGLQYDQEVAKFIPPFKANPNNGAYLAATAEYVNRVLSISNTGGKTAAGWQI